MFAFSFVNYGQKIYEKRAALLLLASWPRGGLVQANWASAWIDFPGRETRRWVHGPVHAHIRDAVSNGPFSVAGGERIGFYSPLSDPRNAHCTQGFRVDNDWMTFKAGIFRSFM